jgi:histidinol-phosphate aminotransferase
MPELDPQTHPYLDQIDPYVPPDLDEFAACSGVSRDGLLRLSANENQYGPSPRAVAALSTYREHGFYPEYDGLKRALSRYAGVPAQQIVLTNGADEAIDLLIRLLVEPGQTVVVCPPTFGMYEFCARVNRCRVAAAPRRADFTLDLPQIEATVSAQGDRARLLFLASPGNPHGLATPLAELRLLLELPLFVAVDEAYIEFGGDSAAALLGEHGNLVVIRTFSKWAGLAGLRMGYVLAGPGMAAPLECIRAPYNVSSAAVAAAIATLGDLDGVMRRVQRIVVERERMREALQRFVWLEPVPGQGNFILARARTMAGQDVADALAERGILVQAFADPALVSYVRITIGRPEQNDAVLAALAALEAQSRGEAQ